MRRGLAGDIEPGDRLPLAEVDLIVRSVDDTHAITEVGLAVEHRVTALPRIPVFQGRSELAAWWSRLRAKTGTVQASAGLAATEPPPETRPDEEAGR